MDTNQSAGVGGNHVIQTMPKYKYEGEKPLNREPDIQSLLGSFITKRGGYDRNHSEIPLIDAASHLVTVTGSVETELHLSIRDLKTQFPQHEVLCALQCAGNRRHTMRTRLKEVNGIDWMDGAVMNCLWKGPRLRDVLQRAGIRSELCSDKGYRGHVACVCDIVPCEDCPTYGGSIPLARAMLDDGDCILALEMNSKPLTLAHGYPVRTLFPGILGARSVKWLTRLTVQLGESANHYQQRDYKILPAAAVDRAAAEPLWRSVPSMLDTPVNSIVGSPASGATVARAGGGDGRIAVRGYALPAGLGGPVARVQVSGDGGRSWTDAELDYGGLGGLGSEQARRRVRWAWCLWRARVPVAEGSGGRVVCRAVDSAGNVQPEHCAWNLRGVGYNAWGEAQDLTIV